MLSFEFFVFFSQNVGLINRTGRWARVSCLLSWLHRMTCVFVPPLKQVALYKSLNSSFAVHSGLKFEQESIPRTLSWGGLMNSNCRLVWKIQWSLRIRADTVYSLWKQYWVSTDVHCLNARTVESCSVFNHFVCFQDWGCEDMRFLLAVCLILLFLCEFMFLEENIPIFYVCLFFFH